jgi:D-methionine transport system substrate-binding protein
LTNRNKGSINITIPIGIIGIYPSEEEKFMKMKKLLAVAGSIVLGVSTLAGCGSDSSTTVTTSDNASTKEETTTTEAAKEETTVAETTETESTTEQETTVESKGTITVAASATPHAEILEYAAPILAEQGWDLQVTVFDDYVQPNLVVDSGDFDANYFQHIPYLNNFNEEKGTDLVNAGGIHYEPFGIYPGTKSSLDDIADGDTIAVPNDTTNEARALLLLEANGIITLKDGVGLEATIKDIDSYAVDIKIQELEAAQVSRVTDEVAYVVLNGNYALEAGYSVGKDALAYETSDSEAAQTYVNVIAVKSGNENSEKIQALVDVLKSDEVKNYINETYDGAVIPFE